MKARRTTSTAHAEIPEQRFPSKPPVDDVAALKNPPAGDRTASRIAAWPASAIETTTAHPQAPASVIAVISGRISDAAAGPARLLRAKEAHQPPPLAHLPLVQPPLVQTPLAHPRSHRDQCPVLLLSIAQQRQHRLEFLRGHRSVRPLKMRPTAQADVSLARRPRPTLVPRIQDERLPAVRVHGTTAPASTTDPLPCAAAADWPADGRV